MNLTHSQLGLMDTPRLKQLIKNNLGITLNLKAIKQLQKTLLKSWFNNDTYYKLTDKDLIAMINRTI